MQHGSAGRPSNRAHEQKFRKKVLRLVREKYGGAVGERFGPPRAAERDRIFRLESERTGSEDWVVRYDNRFFQLQPQSRYYAPAQSKVLVCEGRHGTLAIEYRGPRCAGKRSRRLPGPVLSMRSRSALRFRWPNGSGYPQSVIRGARPLAGRCKSERRRRSPRDHRWPCPPLRPKRSALRAPQGCAPGKTNNQLIPKNQKLMRNQKGDTSNELRMGTFLKSFDRHGCLG